MVLLMTATGAAPGVVSSSARNRRPAAVAMRSVLKYGGETISPSTCSGRPARSGGSGCWVLGAAVGCRVRGAGCWGNLDRDAGERDRRDRFERGRRGFEFRDSGA